MKTSGRKYPSNYVKANSYDSGLVDKILATYREAAENSESSGYGFIDGDTFLYTDDGIVDTGNFSDIRNYILAHPEYSEEEIYNGLYDENILQVYDKYDDMSDIVAIFRAHGRFPDDSFFER